MKSFPAKTVFCLFIFTLAFMGVHSPRAAHAAEELVLYSGRKTKLMRPVLRAFERDTGIRVIMKAASAAALVNQLLEEKTSPKADVFVTLYAPILNRLATEQILAPYESAATRKIPSAFKADDKRWVGVTARLRVIMYNTKLIRRVDVPTTIAELAAPKWRGKIGITRVGNNSMQGHLTVLYKLLGPAKTKAFMTGLARNGGRVFKGHTGVRKAVARGEFPLGLVNHYYYFLQKAEGSPVGVVYPDQKVGQMGAVLTITGTGIVQGARNRASAERFVDYLLTPKAQQIYADTNYEFPILPGVKSGRGVPPLESLRVNNYPQGSLTAAEFDEMLKLAQQAGMR